MSDELAPDTTRYPDTPAPRFSEVERRLLLSEPGIGARVIARLEQAGFQSLEQLRSVGVVRAVDRVCSDVGSVGWATRRRPLERAVARMVAAGAEHRP